MKSQTLEKHKEHCDKCGKLFVMKHLHKDKDGQFCTICYHMKHKLIGIGKTFTLEHALSKTYNVHSYISKKNGEVHCSISVSSVLSGKKVKLVLVNDEVENGIKKEKIKKGEKRKENVKNTF